MANSIALCGYAQNVLQHRLHALQIRRVVFDHAHPALSGRGGEFWVGAPALQLVAQQAQCIAHYALALLFGHRVSHQTHKVGQACAIRRRMSASPAVPSACSGYGVTVVHLQERLF